MITILNIWVRAAVSCPYYQYIIVREAVMLTSHDVTGYLINYKNSFLIHSLVMTSLNQTFQHKAPVVVLTIKVSLRGKFLP